MAKLTMAEYEAKALAYLWVWRGIGRTYQIATHLDITTPKARRIMQRLEARGLVRRSRYTAPNDISWEVVRSDQPQVGKEGE